MANQIPRKLKVKNENLHEVSSMSPCTYAGFSHPGKSAFDRKAEEMKAFLKRNPVPKEFLN